RVATITVQVGTAHLDTTGMSLMQYARHYRAAGLLCVSKATKISGFDPVPYQLLCQSLELQLKAHIWLVDRLRRDQLRDKYRHNLEKLWADAKSKRISQYASPTPLREAVIALVAPYYRQRQFNYLDIDMMFRGYKSLKAKPKALSCLARLTGCLDRTMYQSIVKAS
ncbi:MAG TPA: hypothetical protein VFN94_02280, partial [Nitrospiria bacterium]|nr:hypothetical protein [Nitrospiria bacterium]